MEESLLRSLKSEESCCWKRTVQTRRRWSSLTGDGEDGYVWLDSVVKRQRQRWCWRWEKELRRGFMNKKRIVIISIFEWESAVTQFKGQLLLQWLSTPDANLYTKKKFKSIIASVDSDNNYIWRTKRTLSAIDTFIEMIHSSIKVSSTAGNSSNTLDSVWKPIPELIQKKASIF